jgi:hypothetical protein
MKTKTNSNTQTSESFRILCPACKVTTRLHSESCAIGTEILCRECGAILRIHSTSPLAATEIDEESLSDD